MWVDSSIVVRGRTIGLSVLSISVSDRARDAALVAWFCQAGAGGQPLSNEHGAGGFLQLVFDRLRFTVPDDVLCSVDEDWWREASWRAVAEFLRVNDLWPLVFHHMRASAAGGNRRTA